MIVVQFINGDKDQFETKYDECPYIWIPEQKAYLISSIDGDVVIPSAFVKMLKHIEVG